MLCCLILLNITINQQRLKLRKDEWTQSKMSWNRTVRSSRNWHCYLSVTQPCMKHMVQKGLYHKCQDIKEYRFIWHSLIHTNHSNVPSSSKYIISPLKSTKSINSNNLTRKIPYISKLILQALFWQANYCYKYNFFGQ